MQGFGKDSVFENSSQGSCCSCVCVSLYLSLCLLLKTHTFHAYHTGHSRLSAEHSNRPSCECTLTLGIIRRTWLTALRLIVATIIFISSRADASAAFCSLLTWHLFTTGDNEGEQQTRHCSNMATRAAMRWSFWFSNINKTDSTRIKPWSHKSEATHNLSFFCDPQNLFQVQVRNLSFSSFWMQQQIQNRFGKLIQNGAWPVESLIYSVKEWFFLSNVRAATWAEDLCSVCPGWWNSHKMFLKSPF